MVANVGWNLSVIQPRIWACPSIKWFGLSIEQKQVEEYLLSIDPSRKVLSKSIRVPLSMFRGSRTTNHQLSFSVLINLSGSSWISYSSPPPGNSRCSRCSVDYLLFLNGYMHHLPPQEAPVSVKGKILMLVVLGWLLVVVNPSNFSLQLRKRSPKSFHKLSVDVSLFVDNGTLKYREPERGAVWKNNFY